MATGPLLEASRAPIKLRPVGANSSHALCHRCWSRAGAMSHTFMPIPSTRLMPASEPLLAILVARGKEEA